MLDLIVMFSGSQPDVRTILYCNGFISQDRDRQSVGSYFPGPSRMLAQLQYRMNPRDIHEGIGVTMGETFDIGRPWHGWLSSAV